MTCARLVVERRGAASVVGDLHGPAPLGLRPLPAHRGTARVACVQTAAMLVGGDDLALEVHVGAGAALELVELSATLCHAVRASERRIRLATRVTLAAGATLVWAAEPLIAAAGTDVERTVRVALGEDARVLLADAVMLGREDEPPGAAAVRLRAELGGRALLDETIATADRVALTSAAVAGDARVIAGVTLLGARPPAGAEAGMALAGPGAAFRAVEPTAVAALRRTAPVLAAWRPAVAA